MGQKKSLPPILEEGLKSLTERVNQVDLMPAKTDKSGKIVPCSVKAYVEMGEVHTSKDKQVDMVTMDKLAKKVAAHTCSWIKMLNVGDAHDQQDRVRKSFIGGVLQPLCAYY